VDLSRRTEADRAPLLSCGGRTATINLLKHILTVLSICVVSAPGWGAADSPQLIRTYGKDYALLADISIDGHFILTNGYSACPPKGIKCSAGVLGVYEAATGKLVRELVAESYGGFTAVGFIRGHKVIAAEYRTHVSTVPRVRPTSTTSWIRWDPDSGTREEIFPSLAADFSPVTPLDEKGFLGVGPKEQAHEWKNRLKILDPESNIRDLPIYLDPLAVFAADWRAWQFQDSLLIRPNRYANSISWVSTQPSDSPRVCQTFPGEIVYGYAISADGKLIAAITSGEQPPGRYNASSAYINVLDRASCDALHRFELQLPKEMRADHAGLFKDDFAKHVAISPDNRSLAVAYGLKYKDDGVAYFGLYSLVDGHHLATLKGDTYRGGFWEALRELEAHASASFAPILGGLRFSPDSTMLFATSKFLRQWDVSRLQ
jgi:hypothetical protein